MGPGSWGGQGREGGRAVRGKGPRGSQGREEAKSERRLRPGGGQVNMNALVAVSLGKNGSINLIRHRALGVGT